MYSGICRKMPINLIIILLTILKFSEATLDMSTYRSLTSFRECLGKNHPGVCLKEKALEALNETIMSDKPITFFDIVDIERNPNYNFNATLDADLPDDASARSMKLTDVLHDKIEEFFKSRVIKFKMAPAVEAVEEGRKGGGGGYGGGYGGGGGGKGGKGGGGGKGGMLLVAMGGMACMVAQMFMGKIAFMAGTALVVAKVALFLSAIIGLKKLSSGDGGGKESHVVYASGGDHGHGGWHRSLNNNPQDLAYKAHAHITDMNAGY